VWISDYRGSLTVLSISSLPVLSSSLDVCTAWIGSREAGRNDCAMEEGEK
jgi:hypothetical protein